MRTPKSSQLHLDFDNSKAAMARQSVVLAVLLLGVVGAFADGETEKVVGGANASPGEFPHQVSLRRNWGHFCGGTLITNRHVVSAAHCLIGLAPSAFNVVTGTISRTSGGQSHQVRNVILHPGYRNSMDASYLHDIAIIVLAAPYTPNAYQRPISVANSDPPNNAPLMLSGWGNITARGPLATILQKATVYAMSNQQCQANIQQYRIYDTQLCTRSPAGIGACQGDSGGPLTYNGQLVGVVSWVFPCALGRPDVYTKAPRYHAFINDVLRST